VDIGEAREAAQRLLHQMARVSDPARRLDAARDLVGKASGGSRERDHLAVRLRVLASLLRDLGLLAANAEATSLANTDLRTDLSRLRDVFDGERTTRAFGAVDRALVALDRNAGPKVVADWLVLQI
jgi:hypothetical protein